MSARILGSPWGTIMSSKSIAAGIIEIGTESHGGLYVTKERLATMPAIIRAVRPVAGEQWYEEDCDWALVVLAFPEEFDGRYCQAAIETSRAWHKDKLDIVAYLDTEAGQMCVHKAAQYGQHERMMELLDQEAEQCQAAP